MVTLAVCAACIYEEDNGVREETDMCSRIPPDMEHVPAGQSLVAHYKHRRLRGDRVSVETHTGDWRTLLRPPVPGRPQVERFLLEVQDDLATMPITQFREKYGRLAE